MSEGSAAAALSSSIERRRPGRAPARAQSRVRGPRRGCPKRAQDLLRNIGARTLLHALKGSDGRVLDALTAVMSPTAAQRMRDDLDTWRLAGDRDPGRADDAGAPCGGWLQRGDSIPEEEAA